MKDKEFDVMNMNNLSDIPPEELNDKVSAWNEAMTFIASGVLLCGITIELLSLNIILPFIGSWLMLLGYRTLRHENGYFMAGYAISLPIFTVNLIRTLVNFTVFRQNLALFTESNAGWILYLIPILGIIRTIMLWRGIQSVQMRAGTDVHASAAATLIFLEIGLFLCGFLALNFPVIVFGVAIIIYIWTFRFLIGLIEEIDKCGYTIKAPNLTPSNQMLIRGVIASLVIAAAIGYTCFAKIPVDWEDKDMKLSADHQQIADQLVELGYPSDVISDLPGEELEMLSDAQAVFVTTNISRDIPADYHYNGELMMRTSEEDYQPLCDWAYVMVRTGEARDRLRIYCHFRYADSVKVIGSDHVHVTPLTATTGYGNLDHISAKIMYDKSGKCYNAAAANLSTGYKENNSFLGMFPPTPSIGADMSYPRGSVNRRGYIAYNCVAEEDHLLANAAAEIWHVKNLIRYPIPIGCEYNFDHTLTYEAYETRFSVQYDNGTVKFDFD